MSKYAIFTMDVEDISDSFCATTLDKSKISMMDGLSAYLDALDKHNIKATFFALAERIDEDKPLLLEAIKRGHDIGLHGNTHDKVVDMDLETFKKEIVKGRDILEKELGVKVRGYRAPGFSIRQEQIDALPDLGFVYDSSIQDYRVSNYGASYDLSSYEEIFDSVYKKDGFHTFKMTLSTGHPLNGMPIGGGGYVRMPPSTFVNRVFRKTIKEKNLYIFYCHPFEVSSKKAPHVSNISPLGWFYLRRGRGASFLKRIDKTVDELKKEGYEFISFSDFIEKSA